MKPIYSIESGKLVARDETKQVILWQKTFDDGPVSKILPLHSGEGCLALLDYSASQKPTFENLLLIDPSGNERWRAPLPQSHDAFVDVGQREQQILAWTWGGFMVEVDVTNGNTREIEFTK